MLFPLSDSELHRELEQYRIKYEAEHGETDLTRRYTSTWPAEQQAWLLRHEPRRYFEGLPPFAKACLKAKMSAAARRGMLDDMPDSYVELFVRGEMRLDKASRKR
jgi:hypothetical protein